MYVIKPKEELNKGRSGHSGRVRNTCKGPDMEMSMESMQDTGDKGREDGGEVNGHQIMKGPPCLVKKTGLVLQAMKSQQWFKQGNYLIVVVFCIKHSGECVENGWEESTRCRKLLGASAI